MVFKHWLGVSLVALSCVGCGRQTTAGDPLHQSPRVARARADYAQQRLEVLTLRIAHDAGRLSQEGIDLIAWGPDLASDRVQVEVLNLNRAKAQVLDARYGAANLRFTNGTTFPRPN